MATGLLVRIGLLLLVVVQRAVTFSKQSMHLFQHRMSIGV